MNLEIIDAPNKYSIAYGEKHQHEVEAFAYFAVGVAEGKPVFLTPDCPFFHNEHELKDLFASEICRQVQDINPIHCALVSCTMIPGEENVSGNDH